jgi:hypothetical protein
MRKLGESCHSFTLGVTTGPATACGYAEGLCTRNGKSLGCNAKIVKDRCRNPEVRAQLLELWRLAKAAVGEIDPSFRFTTIHATRDFPSKPHVDRNNTSHQYAVSFGDFTGGRLIAETDDPMTLVSSTPAAGPPRWTVGGRTGSLPTRARATR